MKKGFSKVLAVSALLVSMMMAFTGCGSGKTTQEWVNAPANQQVVSSMSSADMKIDLVAVDDKTVSFQFKFTDQLDIDADMQDAITASFDQQIDAQASVFEEMRDELVSETKINDVVLRIEYLNSVGSQIYNRDLK